VAAYQENAGNTVWAGTVIPAALEVESTGAQARQVVSLGEASRDASGRIKVGLPETLFDSKQILDNNPLLWDESLISGAGTFTHSIATASTVMAVSLNTAGRLVRQTFRRFNYQSGKTQTIEITGTLGAVGGGAGIMRCVGYYDDNNGIFFKDNEGVIEAVKRSKTTGSVVDTAVPQSAWNHDKLDGTGASKLILNPANSQFIVIDFEWLSIGVVRLGFKIDGNIIFCHHFHHSNEVEGAFMSTPNLPIRFEMVNDGTGVASELEQICATVISESGHNPIGLPQYESNASSDTVMTEISANTANQTYAVLGVKLKAASILSGGGSLLIHHVSLIETTNDDFEWTLRHNPTVTGTFTYADKTNSAMQIARGATATASGGHIIDGGITRAEGSVSADLTSSLSLGSTIAGVADELVLCVRPLSQNANVHGSLHWIEL